jgi:hypothetical protein
MVYGLLQLPLNIEVGILIPCILVRKILQNTLLKYIIVLDSFMKYLVLFSVDNMLR